MEVLCNILIEFGIPLKQAMLIKMCLNETYGRVRVGKGLSDRFSIKNGFRKGESFIAIAFKLHFIICH
jgi:hypothetical protein